jgi:hypothetical protein
VAASSGLEEASSDRSGSIVERQALRAWLGIRGSDRAGSAPPPRRWRPRLWGRRAPEQATAPRRVLSRTTMGAIPSATRVRPLRPIERQRPFGRCGLGLRLGRQHMCRLYGDRPAMPQPDLLPLVWTLKNTRRAAAFVRSSVQEGRTGRTIIWPSRASHYGSEGGSVPPPFWWRGWTHARSPVRTLRQVPTI